MSKSIDHVAFQVKNIEESVRWYKEYCDANVLDIHDDWAMLDISGLKLALVLNQSHPYHVAIKCDSSDEFPPFGAENLAGTHRDGSEYLYLKDPSGNAIEWIFYPDRNR